MAERVEKDLHYVIELFCRDGRYREAMAVDVSAGFFTTRWPKGGAGA
jgi:hypothetical protein